MFPSAPIVSAFYLQRLVRHSFYWQHYLCRSPHRKLLMATTLFKQITLFASLSQSHGSSAKLRRCVGRKPEVQCSPQNGRVWTLKYLTEQRNLHRSLKLDDLSFQLQTSVSKRFFMLSFSLSYMS